MERVEYSSMRCGCVEMLVRYGYNSMVTFSGKYCSVFQHVGEMLNGLYGDGAINIICAVW